MGYKLSVQFKDLNHKANLVATCLEGHTCDLESLHEVIAMNDLIVRSIATSRVIRPTCRKDTFNFRIITIRGNNYFFN